MKVKDTILLAITTVWVLVSLPAFAAESLMFGNVACEGNYQHHLQGVCTNGKDAVYWSFTTTLVKTDRHGKVLKKIPVANHHGDMCFHNGKIYVAVNLGKFNDPKGNADSWVYVYDAETLKELGKHETQEVLHGAGGIGVMDGRFYVVGGLPDGVEENYVYEYDVSLEFVKKHVIKSGWTRLGIQTATFHDGAWWFGCYGSPKILLKTDARFELLGRYEFDCSLGVVGVAKDRLLVAKGPRTDKGRCLGTLHLVRPDKKRGLSEVPVEQPRDDDRFGLTFFGWSDQHVRTDGDVTHLLDAIDAMNRLPGTDFPKSIGGKIASPAFVFGCGDVTEWPTHAAVRGYDKVITERLKFPCYDIMGNHDGGGKVPSNTMKKWVAKRHGGLTYTFDYGGVRFIGLFSQFDPNGAPAQPLTKESLATLKELVTKTPAGIPIVIATHLCFDAMTNRNELVEMIGDANVILILGGHYHKATVHRYRGLNFVQLPSPRDQTEVTVLRISHDRIVAIPYDHANKQWTDDSRKILDVSFRINSGRRDAQRAHNRR